jgi:hypothetical protein
VSRSWTIAAASIPASSGRRSASRRNRHDVTALDGDEQVDAVPRRRLAVEEAGDV